MEEYWDEVRTRLRDDYNFDARAAVRATRAAMSAGGTTGCPADMAATIFRAVGRYNFGHTEHQRVMQRLADEIDEVMTRQRRVLIFQCIGVVVILTTQLAVRDVLDVYVYLMLSMLLVVHSGACVIWGRVLGGQVVHKINQRSDLSLRRLDELLERHNA